MMPQFNGELGGEREKREGTPLMGIEETRPMRGDAATEGSEGIAALRPELPEVAVETVEGTIGSSTVRGTNAATDAAMTGANIGPTANALPGGDTLNGSSMNGGQGMEGVETLPPANDERGEEIYPGTTTTAVEEAGNRGTGLVMGKGSPITTAVEGAKEPASSTAGEGEKDRREEGRGKRERGDSANRKRKAAATEPEPMEMDTVDLTTDEEEKEEERREGERGGKKKGKASHTPVTRSRAPQSAAMKPPTLPTKSGDYTGLAEAKRRRKEMEEKEVYNRADREIEREGAREARITRSRGNPSSASQSQTEEEEIETTAEREAGREGEGEREGRKKAKVVVPMRRAVSLERAISLGEISEAIGVSIAEIIKVAETSKNLKGTYIKCLKDATTAIARGVERMSRYSPSEEMEKLKEANSQLRAETEGLRSTIAALQNRMEELEAARGTASGMAHSSNNERMEVEGECPPPPPPSVAAPKPQRARGQGMAAGTDGRVREKEREERSGDQWPPIEGRRPTPAERGRGKGIAAGGGEGEREKGRGAVTQQSTPPPWAEEIARQIAELGARTDARFCAMEERLLPERSFRPPLGVKPGKGKGDPPTNLTPQKATAAGGGRNKGNIPHPEMGERKDGRKGPEQPGPRGDGKKKGGGGVKEPDRSGHKPPPKPQTHPATPRVSAAQQPAPQGASSWVEVVRKGGKGQGQGRGNPAEGPQKPGPPPRPPARQRAAYQAAKSPSKGGQQQGGKKKGKGGAAKTAVPSKTPPRPKLRPPRTAAIVLTPPPGGGFGTAEAMRRVRDQIDLRALGINGEIWPRRAITGGLMLEIPGEENAHLADVLAEKMREALQGTGIRVSRPAKTAELRVTGLEDSITTAEIARGLTTLSECPEGDIKVGEIRRSPSGLGSAWVRCPLAIARAAQAAGKVRIGWGMVRLEVLSSRPLQCYRCLEKGHTRQRCTATVDRSDLCYRCGLPGHRAAGCDAAPNCPLCAGLGRPAAHRYGGGACNPPSGAKGKKRGGGKKKKVGKKPLPSQETRREEGGERSPPPPPPKGGTPPPEMGRGKGGDSQLVPTGETPSPSSRAPEEAMEVSQ